MVAITEKAHFLTGDGVPANADGTIFPICNIVDDNKLNYIGTGFFITDNGMFVTAKHVIEDEPGPLYVVHFFEEGKYFLRAIARSSLSTKSDFALGIVQEAKRSSSGEIVKNKLLNLSTHIPEEGETVSAYAYPETTIDNNGVTSKANFIPQWYHGVASEIFPDGMGFLKSPALVADMQSLSGCSGGPVFSKNGKGGVIGINSRGIVNQVNIISLTAALLDVSFFDVSIRETHYDSITISKLIDFGFVILS